jgi:methyltransferase (TIGR00027 family)
MRDDRPSLTATLVAFARGIGTRGPVPDPVAAGLVPPAMGGLLDAVARSEPLRAALRPAARGLTMGMVDHLTLRTAAIDGALRTALADGVDQLVILGAGLDARAWRMPDLAGVDVFEVDHPASQAYKRERVEALAPLARSLHFIPVDFETQGLEEAMAGSAHDRSRATFWIWEGVTMYLQRPALVGTAEAVAGMSAPGSTLATTYVRPGYVPTEIRSLGAVVQGVFRMFGEPLVGAIDPEEMAALLEGVGFTPTSDTNSEDWARAEGTAVGLPRFFRAERLVVAVRGGG